MTIPVWVRDVNEANAVSHGACDGVGDLAMQLKSAAATIELNRPETRADGRTSITVREKTPGGGERTREYIVGAP